jgi:mRNA interferase HigB
MRLIAYRHLREFADRNARSQVSLYRWSATIRAARWASMDEVRAAFPKCKVLNAARVRFAISGGDFRLIAALDFRRQIAFVKFVGTHAEYDRIDPFTVSMF